MIKTSNRKLPSQNYENNEPVIDEVSISTKKEIVDDDENLNFNSEIILNNTLLKQDNESDGDGESLEIEYHSPSDLDKAYIKSEFEQERSNEESAVDVKFAEHNLEKGSVLNVNLQRSTECERKCYQEVLGTHEKLFVYLRQENLHELQEKYSENPCITAEERNPRYRSKRTTFWCKACPFKSNAKCDLLIHIVDSHKELAAEKKLPPAHCITSGEDPATVWYKCIDCSYVIKWRGDFNRHLYTHKSLHDAEDSFSCASCAYVTKERRQLVKHMAKHSKLVLKCPHCDFQTHVHAYLRYHIKNIHKSGDPKMFKCTKCPFQTKYKFGLKKHMAVHSEARKLYKCPLCPFETHVLNTLKYTHQLVHKSDEETRIHKCDDCPFKAKTLADLRKHTLVHKNPDEVPMFKCSVCSFQTKYRSYIKRHSQNHQVPEDGKVHQCNLCDYQGKWAVNLRVHFRNVHRNPNEGKMHKCTQCPYQSRYSVVFKKHLLQHVPIEERTLFPCESCDYHAITKEGLKAHWNNKHRNPKEMKKFICAECDFQTKRKANLKVHVMSQHTKPSEKTKSATTPN